MITTLILIIHLIVCLFLIFIVLIQSGKGAEMGAAFGGSSQTLFGARGAATVFSKLTTIAAIVFMISSLSLAVLTAKGGSVVKPVGQTPVDQKKALPQGTTGPVQGSQPLQPSQEKAPLKTPPQPAKPAK